MYGREAFEKARTAAQRALDLDTQMPEAHASLAAAELVSWKFSEAESEIQKALQDGPSYAHAHEVSCWINITVFARLPLAIAECERAVELDPLSRLYNSNLAGAYYLSRDYGRALDQLKKTIDVDSKSPGLLDTIGLAYEHLGDYEKAVEYWTQSDRLDGHEARAKELAHVFETAGNPGILREKAKTSEDDGEFFDAARYYAMLGEKDAAFAALEKAFVHRQIMEIKVAPELDSLRSDRRYADLLRRIGLPQ